MQTSASEHQGSSDSRQVPISQEEYERLTRIKLTEELKSELVTWAKRQAWIVVLIVSVLGIFGISFVIESMVREEVEQEVQEAKEALKPARDAAVAAEIETKNAKETLAALKNEREEGQAALESLRAKADELRDTFAAFDADINNIRALTKKIQDQIELILAGSTSLKTQELTKEREKSSQFEANSKYSVLVFYRPNQEDGAREITEKLLSLGFRSSSTPTDLVEAKKQYSSGNIWVIYTERGERIHKDVTVELDSLGLSYTLQINPSPVKLRRGDMQLLLF